MKYEVASLDDNNQPITLTFDGVNPALVGDSLVLFDAKDDLPLYGFNAVMWSTFRRVEG